jgi:smad nuclear-interacting protein 1
MRALLSSAEAREKERSQVKKRSHGDTNNNDRGRGGDKRHRNDEDPGQQRLKDNDSYYGPEGGGGRGGDRNGASSGRNNNNDRVVDPDGENDNHNKTTADEDGKPPPPKEQKPNFGLSGALSKDAGGGGNRVYKGVVLKFQEPPEARAPNTQWRFYVFKKGNEKLLETLHISKQSAYLMGRNADICDIPMLHPSLSGQHAVLQYRALASSNGNNNNNNNNTTTTTPGRVQCRPYIIDLESSNGTILNGVKIDAARYYQLRKGDVLTFGASTREYVLMTENTTSVKE